MDKAIGTADQHRTRLSTHLRVSRPNLSGNKSDKYRSLIYPRIVY